MPKMKTKKAIKKRFKMTGKGKVMFCKQGKRHILTKKTSKRKRHLKKSAPMHKAFAKLYQNLACLA